MQVKIIEAGTSIVLEEKVNNFLAERTVDCVLHYQATGKHHFCMIEYWPEDEEDD